MTDGRTDRPTDIVTYRVACTWLKKEISQRRIWLRGHWIDLASWMVASQFCLCSRQHALNDSCLTFQKVYIIKLFKPAYSYGQNKMFSVSCSLYHENNLQAFQKGDSNKPAHGSGQTLNTHRHEKYSKSKNWIPIYGFQTTWARIHSRPPMETTLRLFLTNLSEECIKTLYL